MADGIAIVADVIATNCCDMYFSGRWNNHFLLADVIANVDG